MRMEPIVTLSWEESLRDSRSIDEGSCDVQDSHDKETTEGILETNGEYQFVMRSQEPMNGGNQTGTTEGCEY